MFFFYMWSLIIDKFTMPVITVFKSIKLVPILPVLKTHFYLNTYQEMGAFLPGYMSMKSNHDTILKRKRKEMSTLGKLISCAVNSQIVTFLVVLALFFFIIFSCYVLCQVR